MKRQLLTLLVLLNLTACGGGSEEDEETRSRMPVQCQTHAGACR